MIKVIDISKTRAQAATEYLMIVGFVIVILIPGIYLYMKYSQESQDSVINAKIDSITNEIVKAAEQVYTYGEGSQTTIGVDLPKNIVGISFQNNEIVFTVINSKGQQSEIAKAANVKLSGEVTLIPGTKKLNIKSFGDTVTVFVECAYTTPPTKRCGLDFECSKNIEGYQQGGGCLMMCNNNNQWGFNTKCNQELGCNEGTCVSCNNGDLQCGRKNKGWCVNDYCELKCIDGNWQNVKECDASAPLCENGKCTQCQPDQVKCGTLQECGISYPCTMSCGQDNNWVKGLQCTAPTPKCTDGGCVICISEEKRCNGQTIQTCVNNNQWLDGIVCQQPTTCQNGACAIGNYYTISISVTPQNGGIVTKDPDQQTYLEGTTVQLTATPNTEQNYIFNSWSGDAQGSSSVMPVLTDRNKQVTATFIQPGG